MAEPVFHFCDLDNLLVWGGVELGFAWRSKLRFGAVRFRALFAHLPSGVLLSSGEILPLKPTNRTIHVFPSAAGLARKSYGSNWDRTYGHGHTPHGLTRKLSMDPRRTSRFQGSPFESPLGGPRKAATQITHLLASLGRGDPQTAFSWGKRRWKGLVFFEISLFWWREHRACHGRSMMSMRTCKPSLPALPGLGPKSCRLDVSRNLRQVNVLDLKADLGS